MDSKAAIFIWFQRIGDGMFTFSCEQEAKVPLWKVFSYVESM